MNETLDISILGKSLRVTANNKEELAHLSKAARTLDQKMYTIQSEHPHLPLEKIAILAALNTTHEFLSFQNELENRLNSIEQLVVG